MGRLPASTWEPLSMMWMKGMKMTTTRKAKREMRKAILQERLLRHKDKEGEDDTKVIDADPILSKCWTQSQQAQQDEKESSLVKEILSDDKKQQKS